mmetsp:Transcript_1986/g.3540  ORF Transcript_1986/g.3540 Transcript_1986/m.3540 type:complete len:212 (-) Transcript_1986:411-1046(-)
MVEASYGCTKVDIDVAVAEAVLDELGDRRVKGAKEATLSFDEVDGDVRHKVRVPFGNIVGDEVTKLANKFARGGASANNNEGQKAVTLGIVREMQTSSFKTFENAVANLAGVVQVLEEEDLLALALSDTRSLESVGLSSTGKDEKVIFNAKVVAREETLALNKTALKVHRGGLGLVIGAEVTHSTNRLLNGAELKGSDHGAGKEWRKEKVV